MDISTATNKEKGSFTGVSYKEGNKWNRNAYQKCNRGKTSEETCAYNTGYYDWLCVGMTLRRIQ